MTTKKKIIEEERRDVIGYEGLYSITKSGRIFRSSIKKRLVNGEFLTLPPIELSVKSKSYYPSVALAKNGKQKTFYVHRLVAIHFIHNPDPLVLREINHKDKNIFNYTAENLEWCTRSENMKHAKSGKKILRKVKYI